MAGFCHRPPPFSSDTAEISTIDRENEYHQGASFFCWFGNFIPIQEPLISTC